MMTEPSATSQLPKAEKKRRGPKRRITIPFDDWSAAQKQEWKSAMAESDDGCAHAPAHRLLQGQGPKM